MKKTAVLLPAVTVLSLLLSTSAHASSIGIGGALSDSPYKGYGAVSSLYPNIDYENESFYIKGLGAGVFLLKEGGHKLSAGLNYVPTAFKPYDSDDWRMHRLDKRKATLAANLAYSYSDSWGTIETRVMADTLNESQGVLASASYRYTLQMGDLSLIPSVGVNWANNKYNNYYFGISHKESMRSGFRYYNAESSFTPYIQLVSNYALTQHIGLFAGARVEQLTGDAKDSPMVANQTIPSLFLGLNYLF